MPTYEYRCKACDHGFEIVQSFSDDPLDTCPECSGALRKVYGNVGISFKGSGFYKTDARSNGSKSGATSGSSADSGSSESSSSGSTSDTTTKPDKKADKKSDSSSSASTTSSSSSSSGD